MFTNRYYKNYILIQQLSKMKYLTGTILTDRKELPNIIKKKQNFIRNP